ncbi:glycine/D-amino acid oxidase-like deaminating enzyme [Rhizobium sp. SG_E_25_P2]|uniref:NAD(P)/FAD-dependent oxidoreductase n=1 Tax=Rhizobium sp. SG_E_25_P2 TaxID=2879942 RepID=UPI002475C1FA|nr:FAD-binding oxidoreductase [Rhizobium sp. SG_E_25_P2]MDH6268837.1 glycine/D-amino acid oxidase-like deaminating enzyme [Rhizobium sp. SG_E_25_P2]
MSGKHIIVIGGGVIGASITWHFAKAGANVTVFCGERGGVATPNSFAWINANWGNPEPYFRLRIAAMAGWRRLSQAATGVNPQWCGSICYDLPPEGLEKFATEQESWGYGIERINREEILSLEPAIKNAPDWALKIAEEGMIEPRPVALALLADAEKLGASIHAGTEISSLALRDGRVIGVMTTDGVMEADEIVLAAGAETANLAATAGVTVPMSASPGLIIDTRPAPRMLNHIVVAPEMEMRQAPDGRIIASTSFNGTEPGVDPNATARRVFDDMCSRLVDGDRLELEGYRIGYRPIPEDGFSIVGRAKGVEGLYIAVTHSGITLAPAIGEFAAKEVLEGGSEPRLAPYRLSRFG